MLACLFVLLFTNHSTAQTWQWGRLEYRVHYVPIDNYINQSISDSAGNVFIGGGFGGNNYVFSTLTYVNTERNPMALAASFTPGGAVGNGC